jgi:serine/threonine protein kinase
MKGPLSDLCIKTSVEMTEEVIKYCLKSVLESLDFMHARKLIHRDIKSDNILYNMDGDIRVADFGISRQLTED